MEMLAYMMEAEDADWMTENVKADMIKYKDGNKKAVKEYVIKVGKKLAAPLSVDSLSAAAPIAQNTANTLTADATQVNLARVNASIEFEKLTYEAKLLSTEVRKVADWSAADFHVVEVAMTQIADWRERFDKIKESYFVMKRNILTYDHPADDDLLAAESKVNCLSSELDLCIEDLQFEDETRCGMNK